MGSYGTRLPGRRICRTIGAPEMTMREICHIDLGPAVDVDHDPKQIGIFEAWMNLDPKDRTAIIGYFAAGLGEGPSKAAATLLCAITEQEQAEADWLSADKSCVYKQLDFLIARTAAVPRSSMHGLLSVEALQTAKALLEWMGDNPEE